MARASRREDDDDDELLAFDTSRRSYEKTKARAENKRRFDSPIKPNIDIWRPKDGENFIRILPPKWKDADHFAYDLIVHNSIGADQSSYLCIERMGGRGKCPICAAAKAAKNAGEDQEYKDLNAREAFACYVLDRNEKGDPKPRVYVMSWTQNNDLGNQLMDHKSKKVIYIDDPLNGYDVTVKRTPSKPFPKYSFSVDREPSPITEDRRDLKEIMRQITEVPIPDTLLFQKAEYLERVLEGTAGAKDKDLDDDPPRGGRERLRRDRDEPEEREERTSTRSRRDPDDDDDTRTSRRRDRDEDDDRSTRRPRDDDDERSSRTRARNRDDDEPEERETRRRPRDDDEPEERSSRRRDPDDDRPRTRTRDDDEPPFDGGRRRNRLDDEPEERSSRRRPRDDDEPEERESRRARR